MQKFLFLIIVSLISCNSSDTVYVCNGPQSKAYHKTNHCKGLRRCTTDIETIDITTAKERQRRECGYCYPDH